MANASPPFRAPYGAFNFRVTFDGNDLDQFGGFSEVSGLSLEIPHSEYRAGTDPVNRVQKIPGIHKVGDVTLKRGIVDSKALWEWLDQTRKKGYSAKKKIVTVALLDDANGQTAVQTWTLHMVSPMKYTGPTLNAKGGGDVAIEELVLSVEGINEQA